MKVNILNFSRNCEYFYKDENILEADAEAKKH